MHAAVVAGISRGLGTALAAELLEHGFTMSKMKSVPAGELTAVLRQGEYLIGCVAADAFQASEHDLSPSNPHVAVTEQRIVLFSRKGIMKKRLGEGMSWPLAIFTDFINLMRASPRAVPLFCDFVHSGQRDCFDGIQEPPRPRSV